MSILTAGRLKTLAAQPHLHGCWSFLSASVLGACNRPGEVAVLYEYAMSNLPASDQLLATAKMREAILKSTALIGLPRVINSLTELKNVTPPELRATGLARENKIDFRQQGQDFWDNVYGKISSRVSGQLANAYPDLAWYAKNFVYGPLLSDTSILSPKETSLAIVATLVPLDVNPQLKGHLKGAINNGATVDEVNAARDLALLISTWSGITWRSDISKL